MQTQAVDPDLVERYRKVSRLASEGADGERDVAARTAAKMRATHPGLEEAARIAEQRERAKEAMRGMGMDPSAAGFDDSEWFAGLEELFEHAQAGREPSNGMRGMAEEAWWSAIRWAMETIRASELPQEPPINARGRRKPKGRQSEKSIKRRIADEVDIEEAYEDRDNDTDEPLVYVAFTMPADLWDHIVGAKNASRDLVKRLDQFVEEYDPDAFDDDDDTDDDTDDDSDEQ